MQGCIRETHHPQANKPFFVSWEIMCPDNISHRLGQIVFCALCPPTALGTGGHPMVMPSVCDSVLVPKSFKSSTSQRSRVRPTALISPLENILISFLVLQNSNSNAFVWKKASSVAQRFLLVSKGCKHLQSKCANSAQQSEQLLPPEAFHPSPAINNSFISPITKQNKPVHSERGCQSDLGSKNSTARTMSVLKLRCCYQTFSSSPFLCLNFYPLKKYYQRVILRYHCLKNWKSQCSVWQHLFSAFAASCRLTAPLILGHQIMQLMSKSLHPYCHRHQLS